MKPDGPIIVTGGAGFIGSHLVERLLADGERVIVIDDCSTGAKENLQKVAHHPGLQFIRTKISVCPDLEGLIREASAIYHLAAAVGVEVAINAPVQTMRTNVYETEIVLEIASRHHVPLVLTSTSEVYGKSDNPGFDESDDLILGPPHVVRWSYACSKLLDEFFAFAHARESRLPVIVARLFNTIGPRQTGRYGMVLPRFISAAKEGRPLRVYGDGNQTRCFCYVADTVEALVRLQRCPDAYGEIFNIGTTEEITIRELAELVVRVLGSSSPIELVPYDQLPLSGFEDMRHRRPVIRRLEERVGYRPTTSLEEAIRLTTEPH